MPNLTTITAGSSSSISLAVGQTIRLTGLGTAQLAPPGVPGAPRDLRMLSAAETSFGPYAVAATLNVQSASGGPGVSYYVQGAADAVAPGAGQSGGEVLGSAEVAAARSLVAGAWILDAATAGQSTEWLPLIGGGFRLAYALDSGTTATAFSVDISADGSTSLGQAFTGSWASSTAFEDTGQRLVSNVNATHFRFNVLSGGPLSVKRLA